MLTVRGEVVACFFFNYAYCEGGGSDPFFFFVFFLNMLTVRGE